ncbi:MAG: hypothetical protein J4F45_09390 [Pseudomonadales bacterium]|nr:hypothetical protein [Pseudomonadales bacterium]
MVFAAHGSEIEYRDEPMLEDRRPLPRNAWTYHQSLPHILDVAKEYYTRVGVSTLLTDKEIGYFQSKGTNPIVLYDYITEFGITPTENRRLEKAGITFAIGNLAEFNSLHYAALSDVVVEGTVAQLVGHPRGIYHTKVVLDVDRIYKDCGAVSHRGRSEFWLLTTGPHQNGDRVDDVVDWNEPKLRVGERVLILAGVHPLRLRRLVGSALHNESLDSLRESFGSARLLIEAASRSRPDVREIYQAFKVVRNEFVIKSVPLGLRVKQPTDVMEREYFAGRVAAIFNAQRDECRARVRRSEKSPPIAPTTTAAIVNRLISISP